MSIRTFKQSLPLVALLAIAVPSMAAAAVGGKDAALDFSPETKVWFQGDSTLHPYTFRAGKVKLTGTLVAGKASANELKDWAQGGKVSDLDVVIPVKALKSGEGMMDSNMCNALHADDYPSVKFSSSTSRLKVKGDGTVDVELEGRLSINGTDRPTTLHAEGSLSGNTFHLKGSKELNMSDFSVNPPTFFMGTLKVKDRVTVYFDLEGKVRDGDS